MKLVRREIRRLTALSGPVVLTQLSSMMLWTVDLLMVGHLGVDALNAVSLGRLWIIGTAVVGMGLVYGIDALAAQAHGARARQKLGDVLLHGSTLALLVSVPLGVLWLYAGDILRLLGQDARVVEIARQFVLVQIPSLPFFFLFIALKQYLQARGIVRPALVVSLAANVMNAGLNYLLIFGHGGFPALGAAGAGISTALTEVAMVFALVFLMVRYRLQRGAVTVLDVRRVRLRGLLEVATLGAPVSVQFALEYWAFALATLWAGRLGSVELAAHSIVLTRSSMAYMVPFGISVAATTRVGNLLGAGEPLAARRAAWVAFGLGAGTMSFFAVLFVLGRRWIPSWYSGDVAVLALTATLMPIMAAFELFDGTQAVGGGILRGMGRTRPAAFINLVGYYVLAMPLAAWLGARERLGLAGIWWGLAAALLLVALMLVAWVARRGPDRVQALVRAER